MRSVCVPDFPLGFPPMKYFESRQSQALHELAAQAVCIRLWHFVFCSMTSVLVQERVKL